MRSVELFAGAGDLAIGMSNAGFRHAAVAEWDHDACETFRENQRHHMHSVELFGMGNASCASHGAITLSIL